MATYCNFIGGPLDGKLLHNFIRPEMLECSYFEHADIPKLIDLRHSIVKPTDTFQRVLYRRQIFGFNHSEYVFFVLQGLSFEEISLRAEHIILRMRGLK